MNAAVNAFFLILKLLSLYFLVVSLFSLCKRKMQKSSTTQRRFAVLIAARNEESCIAGLIESLLAQNYPSELFDIWVLPNNCTDHTADAARHAGGKVLEMPTSIHSKGAALQYAANTLLHGSRYYDAFCVFDADNEVDPAFLSEMNQALSRSAIVKSRILAKNRMQAGISACYEIYFCTANHFLNRAREALGLSARVIGTGFAIRRDLLEALGGFPCCTLAEDAELYAACLTHGVRIGYCESAVTYERGAGHMARLARAAQTLDERHHAGFTPDAAKAFSEFSAPTQSEPAGRYASACVSVPAGADPVFYTGSVPRGQHIPAKPAGQSALRLCWQSRGGCCGTGAGKTAGFQTDRRHPALSCFHGVLSAAANAGTFQNADGMA